MISQSGPSFTFCTNHNGVIDTYSVKMLRINELAWDTHSNTYVVNKKSVTNFKNFDLAMSAITSQYYSDGSSLHRFDLSPTGRPWMALKFTFLILPETDQHPTEGFYNIELTEYSWTTPVYDVKFAIESETKKNGVSLGVVVNTYDHFYATLIHNGSRLFP